MFSLFYVLTYYNLFFKTGLLRMRRRIQTWQSGLHSFEAVYGNAPAALFSQPHRAPETRQEQAYRFAGQGTGVRGLPATFVEAMADLPRAR